MEGRGEAPEPPSVRRTRAQPNTSSTLACFGADTADTDSGSEAVQPALQYGGENHPTAGDAAAGEPSVVSNEVAGGQQEGAASVMDQGGQSGGPWGRVASAPRRQESANDEVDGAVSHPATTSLEASAAVPHCLLTAVHVAPETSEHASALGPEGGADGFAEGCAGTSEGFPAQETPITQAGSSGHAFAAAAWQASGINASTSHGGGGGHGGLRNHQRAGSLLPVTSPIRGPGAAPRRVSLQRQASTEATGQPPAPPAFSPQEVAGPHSAAGSAGAAQLHSGSPSPQNSTGAAAGANATTSAQPQQQQKQQQGRKRKRPPTPQDEVRVAIQAAAKEKNPMAGLAAYDRALAESIPLHADLYNTLLYLCAGGDSWEHRARVADSDTEGGAEAPALENGVHEAELTQDQLDELFQRGKEIFAVLQSKGAGVSEMAYTALARMAASAHEADIAFATARDMVAAGVAPRLRSFTPALLAYAAAGQVEEAFEVDAELAGLGLDLTEAEYRQLLRACRHGAPWPRVRTLLLRIGRELTALQEETLAELQLYFSSPAAAAAFRADGELEGQGSRWHLQRTTVDAQGVCAAHGGQLAVMDLEQAELEAFAACIAKLAMERERKAHDFERFQAWLEAHGPHHVIIDGANVALFGQNWEHGGFDFSQMEAAYALAAVHDGAKPLMILHQGRTKGPQAQEPAVRQTLAQWSASKTFYATPFGSNDDWYWLYAAVRAGGAGLLVSNDEMRDHIFQLLAPKYFHKWKLGHQVRYRFGEGGRIIPEYPLPYTVCLQHLPDGSWVAPSAETGDWLCARPVQ